MREPSAKCRVDESQVLLRSDEMPELTTDEKRENKVLHVDEMRGRRRMRASADV